MLEFGSWQSSLWGWLGMWSVHMCRQVVMFRVWPEECCSIFSWRPSICFLLLNKNITVLIISLSFIFFCCCFSRGISYDQWKEITVSLSCLISMSFPLPLRYLIFRCLVYYIVKVSIGMLFSYGGCVIVWQSVGFPLLLFIGLCSFTAWRAAFGSLCNDTVRFEIIIALKPQLGLKWHYQIACDHLSLWYGRHCSVSTFFSWWFFLSNYASLSYTKRMMTCPHCDS